MRYIIVFFLLTGCGVAENIADNCNGDELCMLIFGRNDSESNSRLIDLEKQQKHLLLQQSVLYNLLYDLNDMTNSYINQLIYDMSSTYYNKDQLNHIIEQTNNVIEQLTIRLIELEENESVVSVIAPCGIKSGFYEVLLLTNTGKIIAYFENNGNRFLTQLGPGNYTTTDLYRCRFVVNNDGSISGVL